MCAKAQIFYESADKTHIKHAHFVGKRFGNPARLRYLELIKQNQTLKEIT